MQEQAKQDNLWAVLNSEGSFVKAFTTRELARTYRRSRKLKNARIAKYNFGTLVR